MPNRTLSTLLAAIAMICGIAVWNAGPPQKLPEICYGKTLERSLMDRVAKIALNEAVKKKISLQGYAGFIAVETESNIFPLRLIYALRFSPFECDHLGLDGGGFDIEVDRKTLKVMTSYVSAL